MKLLATFLLISVSVACTKPAANTTLAQPTNCQPDASPRVFNTQGSTPLFDAAGKGDFGLVKSLVKNGADINQQMTGCWSGWTAMMIAAAEEKTEVVQFLIDNNGNPNIKNSYGRTALMFA